MVLYSNEILRKACKLAVIVKHKTEGVIEHALFTEPELISFEVSLKPT